MNQNLKQILGVVLGMLAAVVFWQAVMAFIGLSFIATGLQAGLSLLIFSVAIFIAGGIVIKPKKDN